jgi:hypothetical protein
VAPTAAQVWASRALPRQPPPPSAELAYRVEDMRARLAEAREAFEAARDAGGAALQWRE